MRKTFTVFILLSFTLLLSNCATLFKGEYSKVNTFSEPTGADVYVDGIYQGKTPFKLKLKSKGDYKIEFKMEGYQNITRLISNHVGVGWVILDVLGGLLPVVVDALTGSWYHLDTNNINAILEKQQP